MPLRTSASGRSLVTSAPASMIVPAAAGTRPLSTPSRVDLPAPFAPTSATSSAGATSRSIPKSTGPAPKPAVSPRTLRSGSGLEAFCIALAQVGLDHSLVPQNDVRLALREDLAEIENDRVPADSDDHAHHVLDQQHRDASCMHRPDHLERLIDLDVVEPRHHLIEEKEVRLGGDGSRDLEALAVGDGERRHGKAGLGGEPDQLQHLVRDGERLLRPAASVGAAEPAADR